MRSFHEYKAEREILDFDRNFTELCEAIVASGISFDEFWQTHALPTLLQNESAASEEQLLVEFWGGMKNMFGGGQPNYLQQMRQRTQDQGAQQWVNQMQNQGQNQSQNPQVDAAKQKRLQQFQAKADQQVKNVKQRFQVAMKDFLKAVTDDAKNQNDPHMWQIAKSFYQKILSTAQPVIDKFAMKAKVGGNSSYMNQFGQERNAMQQSRQQTNMDAMRQRLQQRMQPHPMTQPMMQQPDPQQQGLRATA